MPTDSWIATSMLLICVANVLTSADDGCSFVVANVCFEYRISFDT